MDNLDVNVSLHEPEEVEVTHVEVVHDLLGGYHILKLQANRFHVAIYPKDKDATYLLVMSLLRNLEVIKLELEGKEVKGGT